MNNPLSNLPTEEQSCSSVTEWIEDLRNNDPLATEKIWHRFVNALVSVANKKLKNSCCRIATGEVVAADAFVDFFKKTPDDFGRLFDRNDLWKILVVITERRAIDAIRREGTISRGGGMVINTCDLDEGPESGQNPAIQPVDSTEPPDVELMLIEAFEERIDSLPNELLRQIAIDRLEGFSNGEIARKHGTSVRSVERKLALIRKSWRENGSGSVSCSIETSNATST